ncbi:MAG: hypothetical protein IJY11_03535 [Clostridia bacterium]|nr:hypothetical protein [Clostridia bacterium]
MESNEMYEVSQKLLKEIYQYPEVKKLTRKGHIVNVISYILCIIGLGVIFLWLGIGDLILRKRDALVDDLLAAELEKRKAQGSFEGAAESTVSSQVDKAESKVEDKEQKIARYIELSKKSDRDSLISVAVAAVLWICMFFVPSSSILGFDEWGFSFFDLTKGLFENWQESTLSVFFVDNIFYSSVVLVFGVSGFAVIFTAVVSAVSYLFMRRSRDEKIRRYITNPDAFTLNLQGVKAAKYYTKKAGATMIMGGIFALILAVCYWLLPIVWWGYMEMLVTANTLFLIVNLALTVLLVVATIGQMLNYKNDAKDYAEIGRILSMKEIKK